MEIDSSSELISFALHQRFGAIIPVWSDYLFVILLIALSAFFSAAELAIISLNDNKLSRQAEEGDSKARTAARAKATNFMKPLLRQAGSIACDTFAPRLRLNTTSSFETNRHFQ